MTKETLPLLGTTETHVHTASQAVHHPLNLIQHHHNIIVASPLFRLPLAPLIVTPPLVVTTGLADSQLKALPSHSLSA